MAGYGSGKTVAFVLKALVELGRNPAKTILLAEPVYPMIRDVLQPTLEEVLDLVGFKYSYRASDYKYTIYWQGGYGHLILRSAENFRRWAGLNLAGFGSDEGALLKDDMAWKMGLSRLRDGDHLSGWVTTTPEVFNWVYDYWKDNPKEDYQLIQGKTEDNPFLPEEFVKSLIANYDEKLILAYLQGEFVNLQYGQTYYMFDRERNVKEYKYDNKRPLYFGMDFNLDPCATVLFQIFDQSPKVRIFDAIALSQGGNEIITQKMISHIKQKYKSHKYICFPDATGGARSTSSAYTDIGIIKKNGVEVRVGNRNPFVKDRVDALNNMLQNDIIIDPKCRELITDFEKVINKEGTRDIDKTKDKSLTHLTDAIGYAISYLYPTYRANITSTPRFGGQKNDTKNIRFIS